MSKENLYLIKLTSNKESFYKIGTTVHRYCRFYEIMKHGYDVEIVYMLFGLDFYKALETETYLQCIYEKYNPLEKFGGYTECFINVDLGDYKGRIREIFGDNIDCTENLKITWR